MTISESTVDMLAATNNLDEKDRYTQADLENLVEYCDEADNWFTLDNCYNLYTRAVYNADNDAIPSTLKFNSTHLYPIDAFDEKGTEIKKLANNVSSKVYEKCKKYPHLSLCRCNRVLATNGGKDGVKFNGTVNGNSIINSISLQCFHANCTTANMNTYVDNGDKVTYIPYSMVTTPCKQNFCINNLVGDFIFSEGAELNANNACEFGENVLISNGEEITNDSLTGLSNSSEKSDTMTTIIYVIIGICILIVVALIIVASSSSSSGKSHKRRYVMLAE